MNIKELFDQCLTLSYNKRQDYTSGIDHHENFKRVEEIQSWFTKKEDKPYVGHIATKLARLASLLSTDRAPNNESIEDSFKDLINYCGLWAERRLTKDIPVLVDSNPDRNTVCFFCSRFMGEETFKIILGKYRQAHPLCWGKAGDTARIEFQRP